MAAQPKIPASRTLRMLTSLVIAVVLVAAATVVRLALDAYLGGLSPFMLYVAAVLAAGLARGVLCGLLVMVGGGAIGLRFFLSAGGAVHSGAILDLFVFWVVSALVLVTANELRVQLTVAMHRLSAALERSGRTPS